MKNAYAQDMLVNCFIAQNAIQSL